MKHTLRRITVGVDSAARSRVAMKPTRSTVLPVLACLSFALPALAGTLRCPADSVKVGNACIDRYEASVWQIDPANKSLVKKVQVGKATLADLTGGGATQLRPAASVPACSSPGYPANFPRDGNWTPVPGSSPPSPGVYAVSVAGVLPSTCTTWFQAVQACAVSGKRLVRNEEWQRAAAGTPDPGTDNGTTDCNISGPIVNTGSRANCMSSWGVFDMVGNVGEWVAEWADQAQNCTDWTSQTGIAGGDAICFGGPGGSGANPSAGIPAALIRGGFGGSPATFSGSSAGVFSVDALFPPSSDSFAVAGFRCAR